MIRRGALTQLFLQSPTGEVPFGGRSNQFHHLDGSFSLHLWTEDVESRAVEAHGFSARTTRSGSDWRAG